MDTHVQYWDAFDLEPSPSFWRKGGIKAPLNQLSCPFVLPSFRFSQTLDKMKTELERTCECIVRLYHQYAILDPMDDYLHFREFKKLMKEQAHLFMQDTIPVSGLNVEF